jgi:rod shape-determining protein MreC
VLSFFLLILPYFSPRFRGLLNNFITPVLPGFGKTFYSEPELAKENKELLEKLKSYEAKQDYWDSLYEENQKLRKQNNLEKITVFDTVVANITVRNPLTGKYRFIIDKGKKSGLALGMPVMVGKNLLGRIVEVEKDHAVVGTLAMKNISVYCQIKGADFHGKLNGEADRYDNRRLFCNLTWLPRDAEITKGMVVLTSKFSSESDKKSKGVGLIPENLKIGKVLKVSKNEKFQEAVIELSAPWVGFETVTVLKKPMP